MIIAGGLLLGLVVGILYGLTGLNAILLVPALVFLYGMSQHRAQGTTIATLLLPVGAFAAYNYWKSGDIDLRLAGLLAVGFIIGAWLSSGLVHRISDLALRRGFAVVLLIAAIRMLFK